MVSEASALRIRGNVAISQGETARHEWDESEARRGIRRAEMLFERSRPAREAGDEWGVAKAKHWRAIISLERGDYVRAAAELDEALATLPPHWGRPSGLHGGWKSWCGGIRCGRRPRAGAETLVESLVLADELRYRWWIGWCLDNLSPRSWQLRESSNARRGYSGGVGASHADTGEPIRSGLERVREAS